MSKFQRCKRVKQTKRAIKALRDNKQLSLEEKEIILNQNKQINYDTRRAV